MLVCTVYIPEKTDGIYPLLRSTKRGRYALSGAKFSAVLLLSIGITILFSGTSFAVIAAKIGFSSPNMPLQVLSAFEYCPYLITVGEYFAIHTALRLAGVLIFALVCTAITTVRCDYVISFSGAALLTLINFLLNTISYNSVNSPARHLNLFSLCDAGGIFDRYYAVNFFGSLVPLLTFGLCFFIPILIAASVWAYLAIARGRGPLNAAGILSGVFKRIKLPSIKKRTAKILLRRCGLAGFEAHKVFGKVGIATLLILLAVIRINSSITAYDYPTDADEIFYREYLEYLDGEYTEEKAQYLRDEIVFINTAIQKYEKQLEQGIENLSVEELNKLIDDANYAYAHKSAAERASDYSNKLRNLIELGESDAVFLYETGWQLLLGREADLLSLAFVLLAVCNIFGVEFGKSSSSGRFADILRATKKGRRSTFFSKLTVAGVMAATVFLLFEAVDLCLILKNYTLPHPESASVILFDSVQIDGIARFDGVTFSSFAFTSTLLRAFATLFFVFGVFALSAALKKNISVMLISALAILLPSAISGNSGLTVLSKIDFLPLAAGAELIKLSEETTPDSPFSMPIAAVIILSVAAVLIIAAAHNLWCNPYHKTRRLKT